MTTHRQRATTLRKIATDLLAIADQIEGLAPKRTPATASGTGSWVSEALTLWQSSVGAMNAGRLGKALSPLVQRDGWALVQSALECYLRDRPYQRRDGSIFGDKAGDSAAHVPEPDRRFMGPEDFAKTYQTWRARCRTP